MLANRLAGFEMGCSGGIKIEDLVDTEVTILRGTEPNLATLTTREYAQIFYSTLETDIFPRFTALGMDPMLAWAERSMGSA